MKAGLLIVVFRVTSEKLAATTDVLYSTVVSSSMPRSTATQTHNPDTVKPSWALQTTSSCQASAYRPEQRSQWPYLKLP